MIRIALFTCFVLSHFPITAQKTVYPLPRVTEAQLQKSTEFLLSLTEEALTDMVPVQGGFRFSGSPETLEGAQENNMIWRPELGEKIQCQYTETLFPNAQFPENGFFDFPTPSGKVQRFRYHQASDGKKYWFEARKWYEQRLFLEQGTYRLAQLYALNPQKNKKAGKYACIILKRFAELYPDYIITFDYPGQEKKFYTHETYPAAVEERKHDAWRLAKWSWWAYMDVSESLLLAYDLLKPTALLSKNEALQIEADLFLPMLKFVERYASISTTNMHPTLWRAQAAAANILSIPSLIDTVNLGMANMLREQFSHGGFWREVTASYHRQTASGLLSVFKSLYPGLDQVALNAKMQTLHPTLLKTEEATTPFQLPNSHYAAINDTWAKDTYHPRIDSSVAHLETGVGYGVLGMGKYDDQLQAHLNFNGFHGHDHYANLNLTLFGKGKELLSDIGYTHTKARTWAASTTAHNLVVFNGKSQSSANLPFAGRGNLLLFNASDPFFQAIEADASSNYKSEGISTYRRALVSVGVDQSNAYVLDIFNVAGPGRKDWIFHGSADESQQISTKSAPGAMTAWHNKVTLMPAGMAFREVENLFNFSLLRAPYWGHGNFRNVRQAQMNASSPVKTTFSSSEGAGAGLNSWLMANPKDTLYLADSWAVRHANENQGKLDDFIRSSILLTRYDSAARFTALHAPFQGQEFIDSVTQIYQDKITTILKVSHHNGVQDYLIYQSERRSFSGEIDGWKLFFDGRIGLLRMDKKATTLKMIEGRRFSFGSHQVTNEVSSGDLFEIEGNILKLKGYFNVPENEVIIVTHGDGYHSAFHVSKIEHKGGNTLITTKEPPVYSLEKDASLKMNRFPFEQHPGPHRVKTSPLTTKQLTH